MTTPTGADLSAYIQGIYIKKKIQLFYIFNNILCFGAPQFSDGL